MQRKEPKIEVVRPRKRSDRFKQMVEDLSDKTGYPKYFIEDFYDYFSSWMLLQISSGEEVIIPAIGRFRRKRIKPRLFYSPIYDTHHIVYTTDSVVFKPSTSLKNAMKKGRVTAEDKQSYLLWLAQLVDNGKLSKELYNKALEDFNKPEEEIDDTDDTTETDEDFED